MVTSEWRFLIWVGTNKFQKCTTNNDGQRNYTAYSIQYIIKFDQFYFSYFYRGDCGWFYVCFGFIFIVKTFFLSLDAQERPNEIKWEIAYTLRMAVAVQQNSFPILSSYGIYEFSHHCSKEACVIHASLTYIHMYKYNIDILVPLLQSSQNLK